MAADHVHAAQIARRGSQLAGGSAAATIDGRSIAAMAHAISGEVEEALILMDPLVDEFLAVDELFVDPLAVGAVPQTLKFVERWASADAALDRVVSVARAAGAPSMLTFPLAVGADSDLRHGRLAASYAAASESVQLAAETGQIVESSFSLVTLARIEAVLGLEEDCRAHLATGLEHARQNGVTSIELFAAAALGLLELSLGHADRAVAPFGECQRLEEEFNVQLPTLHMGAADHIEACVRSGALAEAESSLAVLERRADQTGLRWPAAMAARCRGLLADDAGYEREFATALVLHGADMAFERARTLLCLGMRRRRSRRRADARAALHDALAFFEGAGAEPWAEQAQAELRAAGDVTEPSTDRSLRALTPQELQVALVVAKGATNKEAAASLFLSPKTVEFHLGNAYRKLGLRSRAELVRRVEGLS
jgi:DNA-binding NarL/FixJ family response regulator